MICPNCNENTSTNEKFCQNCGNEFPWIKEIKKLEGMIKVRETSRFRAASTFIRDFIESRKTGEPIPFESVKGLLNAWLFKSGMILIAFGTLTTSVVAISQLVLLYRQENILNNQSKLMNDQNQLEMYGYVKEIKNLLAKKPFNEKGKVIDFYENNRDEISYWLIASDSEIENVVLLSKLDNNGVVETILKSFLKSKNENTALSVGALIALNRINKVENKESILNLEDSQINFDKVKLARKSIRGIIIGKADFSDANFERVTFDSIFFSGQVNFSNTKFVESSMQNCEFNRAAEFTKTLFLTQSSIRNSKFIGTKFRSCKFNNFKFKNNNIVDNVAFSRCEFWGNQNSLDHINLDSANKVVFEKSKALHKGHVKSSLFEGVSGVKIEYLNEVQYFKSVNQIKMQ